MLFLFIFLLKGVQGFHDIIICGGCGCGCGCSGGRTVEVELEGREGFQGNGFVGMAIISCTKEERSAKVYEFRR